MKTLSPRAQEISDAARACYKHVDEKNPFVAAGIKARTNLSLSGYREAFRRGAKWADANPPKEWPVIEASGLKHGYGWTREGENPDLNVRYKARLAFVEELAVNEREDIPYDAMGEYPPISKSEIKK